MPRVRRAQSLTVNLPTPFRAVFKTPPGNEGSSTNTAPQDLASDSSNARDEFAAHLFIAREKHRHGSVSHLFERHPHEEDPGLHVEDPGPVALHLRSLMAALRSRRRPDRIRVAEQEHAVCGAGRMLQQVGAEFFRPV